jgi:hypothetical protein
VPSSLGDPLEAFGPIVAATGEYPDRFVGKMNLNAITVELDLVYPAVAPRHLLDGGSERRFDEAGERSLDTDGCRFLALERHGQTRRIGSGN